MYDVGSGLKGMWFVVGESSRVAAIGTVEQYCWLGTDFVD